MMLPIYSAKWHDDDQPGSKIAKPVISWSQWNWIAFTVGHTWQQNIMLNIDTVFLLNPDKPWELYTVYTHHGGIIEHIEWNHNFKSFLTVDSLGIGKIWVADNHLMNQWKSCSTIDLGDGDGIKKVFWISGFRKYGFNAEKMFAGKDILDKFIPHSSFIPNVGNIKKDGIAVITSGGVFKVIMLEDLAVSSVHQKRLGSIKTNVLAADVCQNDAGKLFVAVLTGPCIVELFSIAYKQNNSFLDFNVEVWPCLVPHTGSADPNFSMFEIIDLKCVSVNNTDQVIICSKGISSTAVQVFEVRKEPVILHAKFPRVGQTPYGDACVCTETILFNHDINSIFISNVRFSNLSKSGNIWIGPKLGLIDVTGTFYTYSLQSLSQSCKQTALPCIQDDPICAGVFSPCDHLLFTITHHGNAYMFLYPHYSALPDQTKMKSLVNYLHYSLVESCVPWDIMVSISTLEPSFIDHCYKCFIEEFSKFNVAFQNLFFDFVLRIKTMFYYLFRDYCGVVETYFASILRNTYLHITSFFQSEKDAIFMDSVMKLCSSSKEVDINKLVISIDTKDINTFLCTDSSYRPLIQWITDYAVHIVRLILSVNHGGQNWKLSLKYFDQTSILYLRKLLLIFFIMYQKSPTNYQFHPIFVTMTTPGDLTTQLFKLVSKIQQLLLGDTSIDITMNDLPFSNLPLMYLDMPSHDPSVCVLSQVTISSSRKEYEEYEFQLKQKWEEVHQTGFNSPLSIGVSPVSTKLRQIFDGINMIPASLMQGELVKQCCQCKCLSIYAGHSTRSFNNSWKSWWEEHCYCGGLWKKVLWHS